MLINLVPNPQKVKEYNEHNKKLFKEFGLKPVIFEKYFVPYEPMYKADYEPKYRLIEEDYRTDFKGVYLIPNTNWDFLIDAITNNRIIDDMVDYGVADNASQILDKYERMCEEEPEMENKNHVILISTIIKKYQPEHGGWRWHKWGKYLGKYKHEYEYLYDETDIDFVFIYSVYEVE